MLSVPQQIIRGAISGDLDTVLMYARMAYQRNERNLLSRTLNVMAVANILQLEVLAGRLTVARAREAAELLRTPELSIPAASVLIRFWVQNPELPVLVPGPAEMELLGVLAGEQDTLSGEQLLDAAQALLH